MSGEALKNRWLIAVTALLVQVCLGSVYAWSVFVKPLMASEGWSEIQVTLTFNMAMACLGIGTMIGGWWQDKVGPRIVTTFAGVIYGLGFLIASYSISQHWLPGVYVGYGLFSGLGMGFGYICPVAMITKWFPDKRGLMTGVNVMGFGVSALIMGPIASRLIISSGVSNTLLYFGVIYGALVLVCAQFFVNPPQNWVPQGWVPTGKVSKSASAIHYTPKQALSTSRFWMLWAMLSLNTSAGIMIVSQASPLAQQQLGIDASAAAAIVGIIGLFNGGGRIVWAWISDKIGRAQAYFLIFAMQIPLFFYLPTIHNVAIFTVVVCLIELCYGGGFGVMPSFAADFFGSKYVGGIYGFILLGWGFAAIPSPLLMAYIHKTTGVYSTAIVTLGVVLIFALIIPVMAYRAGNRMVAAAKDGAVA
ncbi:MAG: OFA family MFS transporter [Acidobacteriaceae bacterium]|jgi:OFA family oxalate/formate antiporter-like MFS transporter|nr:OFA family MFS transporter [Acidobacteriaceae bacterium]